MDLNLDSSFLEPGFVPAVEMAALRVEF